MVFLAAKAGTRIELCPCIVSIQGFGKDVLFDIISRWYDHSETAKTTTPMLTHKIRTRAIRAGR